MADEREILTWQDFGDGSRELADIIQADGFVPEVVVAIARGGLLLAGALAYNLEVKNCGALNAEFYTGIDERLDEPIILAPYLDEVSLKGKKVLLVDDVSDSGRTLKMVLEIITLAGAEVKTTCLYSKSHTVLEPDYAWRSTDLWIMFPWSSEAGERELSPQLEQWHSRPNGTAAQ